MVDVSEVKPSSPQKSAKPSLVYLKLFYLLHERRLLHTYYTFRPSSGKAFSCRVGRGRES